MTTLRISLLTFVVATCSTSGLRAEVDAKLAHDMNDANRALRAGDVDAALAGYDVAEQIEGSSDLLIYNKAVAQYRKGDLQKADELFSQVARSADSRLAANARYNLGNCQFATALQIRDQDRQAAIKRLAGAIQRYRSALSLDNSDADARVNIELAAELMQRLQDEQRQEQQQQKQDQPQPSDSSRDSSPNENSSSDNDSPNQDSSTTEQSAGSPTSSQPEAGQSDPSSGSQQSSGDRQPEANESVKGGNRDQSASPLQDSANQADGKVAPDHQSSPADDTSEANQPASESEQRLSQQSSDSHSASNTADPREPNDDSPSSQTAAESDSSTSPDDLPRGQLTAPDSSDGQQVPAPNTFDALVESQMTKEEARKMLQAIRDRELLRRLRRQSDERSRRVPVERDW